MKGVSIWLWAGIGSLFLLGSCGLLLGWWLPGAALWGEVPANNGQSKLNDSRIKSENLTRQLEEYAQRISFPGTNRLEHRVFVSRTLVFLPEDKQEPVQPLDRKMKMQDGIEVGWKLDHGFNPADPGVKDSDSDQDGFTNLEEYASGSDPNDAKSSPSRWLKIKITSVETNSLLVGFSGKSANRYTLRFTLAGKKKDADVGSGDSLWLAVTSKGLEIGKTEEEAKKLKEACPHVIPLKIMNYHDDRGTRLDEKTKTENDYDDSFLEVERLDGLAGVSKIMLDERGKSRGVTWSVGDIRLVSMVPGEGEMGPYRVGQSFGYAGKEFIIREATTNRVSMLMQPEGEQVQLHPRTP